MIISLSTGQGISGILMNIISYIVIASVNTGDKDKDAKLGAIIFFTISGFILFSLPHTPSLIAGFAVAVALGAWFVAYRKKAYTLS